MLQIPFSNRYVALGQAFYDKVDPVPVENPGLVKFNEPLARDLGISTDGLDSDDLAAFFSGNRLPDGAEPLAMAYAGHQFGHFVPQLGDGRALLLGEVVSPGGECFDIHLKGTGRTLYSRNGDGRAALGPVLREYLVSEAMAGLGVPTTRALAAVTTGEQVVRERMIPGGIITRIARSFVRVGTFQYFSVRDDLESVRALADHVLECNYPRAREADHSHVAMFREMATGQAALIARWMQLGFIHGVMNTDNMSIAGETIDYGPCAFMDAYAHDKVFSSIDRNGRYAYNNQPSIGLWNLTRLAETLLPLLAESTEAAVETAQDVLKDYILAYQQHWLAGMRAKCGLAADADKAIADEDQALIEALFNTMAEGGADFTLTFHYLSRLAAEPSEADNEFRHLFDNKSALDAWLARWRQRLGHEARNDTERQAAMRAVNPVYIPRNHQIEAVIRAAEDHGDFSPFHALHEVLANPYTYQSGRDHYLQPPKPDEVVTQTFCGT